MHQILQKILTVLAKAYLARYRPQIIAVTGNVGKTSTKEAIAAVLGSVKTVRTSGGNLNNELGVPLTILGNWSERYYDQGGTFGFWSAVLWHALLGLVRQTDYPAILILEYGADRPGDIAYLSKNFKPHIAVVTAIGEMPVHVEYFTSPEALAREKVKLVEALNASDFAVLNFDDQTVLDMREKTKAAVTTFGFGERAEVRLSNFDFRIGPNNEPLGVNFKLNYNDSFVPVKIDGSLGRSQAWATGAAAAVGLIFGLNLVKISEAFSAYSGPAGRLKILKGVKKTFIIDDTYNAAPASMHLALETLKDLPRGEQRELERGDTERLNARAISAPGRKISVLGDMLELGKYAIAAHQEAGNFAGTFVDVLITVGPKAKFIAQAAGNQMASDRIFSFDTSLEAAPKIQELLKEGDLILVKGSQGIRMERVVEEIIAEPEKKKELLVRQSKKWLSK